MMSVRSTVAAVLRAAASSSVFFSAGGVALGTVTALLAPGGAAYAQDATQADPAQTTQTAPGTEQPPGTDPAVSAVPLPSGQTTSGDELNEVTVTGSRIRRRDLEANSPIVTVGDSAFQESSTVGIESVLNQLPQFVPGPNQFVTGDIFPSATNTPGIATINLRGLGANRTLVLIDGRRGQPANSTLVIDVNTIPSSAIESVEIISGGASAVYGADAIGGVTNFKLKDNFQGATFEARTGITEEGDGQESRFSTLFGANLGEGRGNAMLGLEWTKREDVLQRDREFYSDAFTDPNSSALSAIRINTYKFQPVSEGLPSQTVVNSLFPNRRGSVANNTSFFFNPDGSLFKDTRAENFQGPIGTGQYRLAPNGTLVENYRDGAISSPLERYSLFGKADYRLNDNVSTFSQAIFVRTKVNAVNQVTGADGGFSASIPYGNTLYGPSVDVNGNTLPEYQAGGRFGLNCPAVGGCTKSQAFPVPQDLATLLNARGPNRATSSTVTQPQYDPDTGALIPALGVDSNWSLGGTTFYLPGRELENTTNLYQILAGLEGDLFVGDWTWEAYVSHGETETDNNYINYASLARYQAVMQSPNYGRGYQADGSGQTSASCTSGIPVFQNFAVTDDCVAAINALYSDRTSLTQDIVETNLQGKLFDMPAGELRSAVGLTYRKNEFAYKPDAARETNSIMDIPIGSFGQQNVLGELEVKEVYTEFLVPLLRDKPFVDSLELELGFRYSDYSTVGGVPTYKGLLSWSPNPFVRLRGGYQLANRAPNINELFLRDSANPVNTRGPDPCRSDTRDFNGNLASNPNRAQVQALCSALINNPNSTYNADPNSFRGDGRTDGGEIELRAGNTELENEEAKTYTLGFVLTSPFEHPAARSITMAIDFYSVKITDAINFVSAQTTYDVCFNRDGLTNPTYSIDDPFGLCRNIVRDDQSGNRLYVNSPYVNVGTIETNGIDLQANWRTAMEDIGLAMIPGSFGLDISLNKIFKYEQQDFPALAARDYNGIVGPTTTTPGQFDFRANTTARYFVGSGYVGLNWRYLPSARNVAYVTDPNTTTRGASSYSVFDLSASYSIGKVVQLTGGIDNLFNTDPEIVGANQTVNIAGGGTTQVNGVGTTNPSYYDVLGRRYYMGVKLSF
jgi:iron complex outermembrane recepter protein